MKHVLLILILLSIWLVGCTQSPTSAELTHVEEDTEPYCDVEVAPLRDRVDLVSYEENHTRALLEEGNMDFLGELFVCSGVLIGEGSCAVLADDQQAYCEEKVEWVEALQHAWKGDCAAISFETEFGSLQEICRASVAGECGALGDASFFCELLGSSDLTQCTGPFATECKQILALGHAVSSDDQFCELAGSFIEELTCRDLAAGDCSYTNSGFFSDLFLINFYKSNYVAEDLCSDILHPTMQSYCSSSLTISEVVEDIKVLSYFSP